MSQHLIDELTEGCNFCANRVPQTVTWSCGWCGRARTYVLLVEDEEQRELCNHIEGIARILGIESEDVLNALLLMLEDGEQHEIVEALCDAYYSTERREQNGDVVCMPVVSEAIGPGCS